MGLRKFRKFSNPHPIFDLSIIKCFIWKMPPKKQQIIPDVSASQNQDPVNIILKSIEKPTYFMNIVSNKLKAPLYKPNPLLSLYTNLTKHRTRNLEVGLRLKMLKKSPNYR